MSKANSPRAQALAAVVLKLTQALRSGFPVEGEPWLAAGEDPNVAQRPLMDVLPRLVDPWYPLRPAEGRRRADPTPDDPPALGELLSLLKQLFDFYGWELLITGRLLRRQRWHWPEVPPLPRKLLAHLERVACDLASSGQGGVEVKPAAVAAPNAFLARLSDLAPLFEAGRGTHPNVWITVAAGDRESYPPPLYLFLRAQSSVWHRWESRPQPDLSDAEHGTRHPIILRRREAPAATPAPGQSPTRPPSCDETAHLYGSIADIEAFVAAAESAGALLDPTAACPPVCPLLAGATWNSAPLARWIGRVYATLNRHRPSLILQPPATQDGIELYVLDLDPWEASLLTIRLLQAQPVPAPVVRPPIPATAEDAEAPAPAKQEPGAGTDASAPEAEQANAASLPVLPSAADPAAHSGLPPASARCQFNVFTGDPLPDGRPTEYRQLACDLLGVDELDEPPLPTITVHNVDDPIQRNVGDLTDRQDQILAAKLGIGPREWDNLNEEQRIGRMRIADLLETRTAGYRPSTHLSRIVHELNNPPGDSRAKPGELEELPNPFDMARRPWLPILKKCLDKIPELAVDLTEEKLRHWLYQKYKVPPTQDLYAEQLVQLFERAAAAPPGPQSTAEKQPAERPPGPAAEVPPADLPTKTAVSAAKSGGGQEIPTVTSRGEPAGMSWQHAAERMERLRARRAVHQSAQAGRSIRLFVRDDQQSYPGDAHVAGLGETERQSRAEGAEKQ